MNQDDVATQRWIVLGLVIASTAAATLKLLAIFRVDGVSTEEVMLLAVFALLFSWIAASFWVACLGAYEVWSGGARAPPNPPTGHTVPTGSRTVLAMPIYNEDCAQVFGRIETMIDSLREAGRLDQFDFFLLSDSTDPQCCLAEDAAWRWMRRHNADARIFYRRRTINFRRKSGNIAEFLTNWGALYDYMVVLDADSLMTGRTLERLVGLMDANPRAALIQAAPLLVGGESLFARIQQFASWVYGPIFVAGLAKLQGADGNYWGHNAIIRVRPFMQHCGLPLLPGRPPLGGEIMSHDFVEAALLRRGGWDVWLVPEIGGSYEATPPNLIAHLKRDQRWCQGNLQHIKLVFAQGLRLQSRIHMAFGAMSYLSSPLWLLLIVLFAADAVRLEHADPVTYIGRYPVLSWPVSHVGAFLSLITATVILLYAPKVLSLALILRNRDAVARFGGAQALIASGFIEIVISTLLAPILMLSHTWFVMNALLGRSIGWGQQQRGSGVLDFSACVKVFAPHTLAAIVGGVLAWYWMPGSFWWFLPLLSGLAVAIVLCWFTSDPRWGEAARRRGIFLVPSEAGSVPILQRLDAVLAQMTPAAASPLDAERDTRSLQAV